jgi:hypothetical protein
MMEASGPGGLGEQGLLGAPPTAPKKRPNYLYFTHTPHDTHHTHTTQHIHRCKCTLPRLMPNAYTDITGAGVDQGDTNSPEGLTAVEGKDNFVVHNNPNDNHNKDTHPEDNNNSNDNDNLDGNVVDNNNNLDDKDNNGTEREQKNFLNLSSKDQQKQEGGATTPSAFRDSRDISAFFDYFLQQLGDRHRWLLYRINFSESPEQQFDTDCDKTWNQKAGPQEMTYLNNTIYETLQKALQDIAPVRPIFWRHRVEHPLSASRVWLSLRDKFQSQTRGKKEQITTAKQLTEKTPNVIDTSLYNRHTIQHNTRPRILYNKHTHTHPRVPYTPNRHTAHHNTKPRVSHTRYLRVPHTRHSTHKETRPHHHETHPHHHTHTITARPTLSKGVNRNQLQFKE